MSASAPKPGIFSFKMSSVTAINDSCEKAWDGTFTTLKRGCQEAKSGPGKLRGKREEGVASFLNLFALPSSLFPLSCSLFPDPKDVLYFRQSGPQYVVV